MSLLYIDTNILIYATEDAKNKQGNDISSSTVKLLLEAIHCTFNIAISNWALEEFNKKRKTNSLDMLLEVIKKKRINIDCTEEEKQQAKQQKPDHYEDKLHQILAEKAHADFIVTRNIKDFQDSKIPPKRPEELL